MEQPTVNENPTVLSVDTRRKVPQRRLEAFSTPSSVADVAVRRALTEASIATAGKGVALLQNMGVQFPNKPEPASFVYAPLLRRNDENEESKTTDTEKEVDDKNSSSDDKGLSEDEVFEIIRNIQDPEHPLTLEQLGVVSRGQIVLDKKSDPENEGRRKRLEVRFTPTIPHCSMATLIGLSIRVKLMRSLPKRFKLKVFIEPGTHNTEDAVNKQLDDKERVAAALENSHLLGIVNKCIREGMLL